MRDGYQARCISCHRTTYGLGTQEWRDRAIQNRRNNWIRNNLWAAKARAIKVGVPFDIKVADLTMPNNCPVLGIPLLPGTGQKFPGSPTIDRFIPKLGYVRGNVSIISWRANRLKMDETDPDVFDAIDAYIRRNT